MQIAIANWESEGGALDKTPTTPLQGTVDQIEWAERIRTRVDEEFDRVAGVLEAASRKQSEERRSDTRLLLGILEEKRATVMGNAKAGYFIKDWQEVGDQVRKMIMSDARYETIKSSR